MLRKHIMPREKKDAKVKWRSHDIHRIEALSDAVFGFAVTLLVVSLEVPKTFHELYDNFLSGMIGFFIGFVFLILIWHDQYLFFRRYGLHDTRTIFWTAALLFVVLFYVYPTKFLFTFLFSQNQINDHGVMVKMVETNGEARQLMMLYGLGFALVYFILWRMYHYAVKMSSSIGLSSIEAFITRMYSFQRLIMCLVGVISICIAYFLPAEKCGIAGFIYIAIYPAISLLYSIRKKRMKKLFSKQDMEAHLSIQH